MAYDIAILTNITAISSKVDAIVVKVKDRIAELKLDELEATEDNKKVIRETRAELNKEKQKYEEDLKAIDKIINKELDELKKQVKEKIKPLYAEQDKLLAEKLEKITAKQLEENEAYSQEYYIAKLKSEPHRLGVRYEDIPWSFGFNSSKKSIRETCDAHFESVGKALIIIDNHEYKMQLEELWIKNKFNIGDALTELQTQLALADQLLKQKEAARLEQEKKAAELKVQKEQREAEAAQIKQEQQEALKVEVEELPAIEEITEYALKIEVTDSQLEILVQFMLTNEIDFELIK